VILHVIPKLLVFAKTMISVSHITLAINY